jgi:hypothetical protein
MSLYCSMKSYDSLWFQQAAKSIHHSLHRRVSLVSHAFQPGLIIGLANGRIAFPQNLTSVMLIPNFDLEREGTRAQ